MDDARARALLQEERSRVEAALVDAEAAGGSDRSSVGDDTGLSDAGELLSTQGTDDAVTVALRERLAALDRADQRLATGAYGRSVTSGDVIPDARLEADPAAELTLEEAERS
jgi:DnaK suppressor protein